MSSEDTNMKFSNPTFNDGLNLTVRRGSKWHLSRHVNIELGADHIITAEGVSTRLMKFSDIDDADLRHEHDPACCTVDGLFKVMQEVYPDFTRDEDVTLVYFIIHKVTPTIGQPVYVPDMVPVLAGTVTHLIPLNDHFWEIHYQGQRANDDGTISIETNSFITSEFEWRAYLKGWFDIHYYSRNKHRTISP